MKNTIVGIQETDEDFAIMLWDWYIFLISKKIKKITIPIYFSIKYDLDDFVKLELDHVDNMVVALIRNQKYVSKKHIARITLGKLCDKFDKTDVKKWSDRILEIKNES